MAVRMEYSSSINIPALIVLSLVIAETFCDSKEGKTPLKCHQESTWNDTTTNCSDCKPGYYGRNCSQTCPFPHFGDGCQQKCDCLPKEFCNFSIGCSNKTTTMYIITSDLMSAMDNMTVEISIPKETLFQDTIGIMFNTNNMSIMVVSVVIFILITLMIVCACKLMRQRYSLRRISNFQNKVVRPDDSFPEPVHYEEILNIAVLSSGEGYESFHPSDIG